MLSYVTLAAVTISVVFHLLIFFFFNDTATTEIYTLSLHDALPILHLLDEVELHGAGTEDAQHLVRVDRTRDELLRSEEHTSELQSRRDLVCRLLLEKKKKRRCEKHLAAVAIATAVSGSIAVYPTGA